MNEPCKSCEHNQDIKGCAVEKCKLETGCLSSDKYIDNLADNWINGNRKDVLEILSKLTPLEAAYVTSRLVTESLVLSRFELIKALECKIYES